MKSIEWHLENIKKLTEEYKQKAMEEKLIIGEDNICPVTNKICDDECCPPGAECNLSGTDYAKDVEIAEVSIEEAKSIMKLHKAISVLIKELKEDEVYYDSWKANIAMSIHDEWYTQNIDPTDGQKLHTLFNNAADRFLKLLCS